MLKPNTKAPLFTLKDQSGELFDFKSLIGQKTIVLFFYPKDNTPGCTAEACSFRDNYAGFKAYDAEVIGISSDSSDSHQAFQNKHQLPYRLLADENSTVAKLYGLKPSMLGLLKPRVSFVIDQDGLIQHAFSAQLGVHKHIDETLRAVQRLAKV
ncbi:MAG: peroxiredoxin [Deltaproteobacteria bacterium]|nr:peroxiredoxin [Deltaproteobacteria bacterium]